MEAGATCRIVSSDKDLMQLIRPGVTLYDTMKDRDVGEDAVLEKFGVTPDKVIDVQALAGDSTDNVPGVPGIGVKTAAQLLAEYGDLETLLARAGEIKQQKRRENLIQFAEQASISKRLVTLDDKVPVTHDVSEFAVDTPKASQLIGFLKALEFSSFTKKVAGELDADMAAIDPAPVEINHWPPEDGGHAEADASSKRRPLATARPEGQKTPEIVSEPFGEAPAETRGDVDDDACSRPFRFVTPTMKPSPRWEGLDRWIAEAEREHGYVAVDTETDALDSMQANLVGVSLALAPGRACYIPLAHMGQGGGLFGGDKSPRARSMPRRARGLLKPLLEDPGGAQDRPEPEI